MLTVGEDDTDPEDAVERLVFARACFIELTTVLRLPVMYALTKVTAGVSPMK
jgi:hypothetical protein